MSDLTIKQEGAARSYIELGIKKKAYEAHYNTENMSDNAISVEADRLFNNPKVSLRVKELKAEHAARHAVTVDSITLELEEARSLALQEKQTSAAVSASMGKAKLHGLGEERLNVSGDLSFTINKNIHSAGNNDKHG